MVMIRLPVKKWLFRLLFSLGFPVEWDISAGGIIFFENSGKRQYLLIRYPSGHFDYARGHVEGKETLKEAARREITEETGITAMQFFDQQFTSRFFYVARTKERERRKREGKGYWIFKEVFMFPVEVFDAMIALSHEHTEFVWLSYEEALEKVTYANARRMLRETEAYLEREKA